MGTVYSSYYSTGTYTKTRVKVDYSGTSATATLLYTRTNTWSGETSQNGTFTFGGSSTSFNKAFYGQQTDAVVASVSFTVSTSGGTYSGTATPTTGFFGFSGSVAVPAQATPPTGLSLTNIVPQTEGFSGTAAVTSWGTGGTENVMNFSVCSVSGDPTNRAYTRVTGGSALSYNLTVSNTSYSGKNITIQPNKEYYLTIYTNNGAATAGGEFWYARTTLPPALSAKSVGTITANSIQISYTTAADGGKYTKNIQYSLNNSTWTTGATVSSSSATSGTFTISGLSGYTNYTIYLRVNTTAGSTSSGTLSARTSVVAPSGLTSSVVETYSNGAKLSGSISSYGAPASENDRYIELGITSGSSYFDQPRWLAAEYRVTSATKTITNASIVANTRYYYGIYATNTASTNSTTNGTFVTKPAAPTASTSQITATSVRLTISAPSQGTAGTITAYYCIKKSGGSYGSWVTIGTVSPGSSVSVTINNLDPGSTYYISPNLNAGYGGTSGSEISFATLSPLYGSVNGKTKLVRKLYGSVNGQTKLVRHLYGSVNGKTKRIF